MKILAMSDTHGMYRLLENLPEADLLIHAGDSSIFGDEDEIIDFVEWFIDLPYRHKVFITGNHDFALHRDKVSDLPTNCYFLNFSIVELEGINVCGIPFFLERKNYVEGIDQFEAIGKSKIDLLVSHQPPYGILDYSDYYGHYGSPYLLRKVRELKPKCHIFGHMHEGYGKLGDGGILFVNCSLMGDSLERLSNPPILLEI
ncbi:MAG: metallophosphatase domain-containing protein [Porphyromonas sp.]|nr:metallophosphatase domain-containing protein [Porphyromonas sp.]